MDFVIEASNYVHMMEAPKLFAFCCKQKIVAKLNGTVTNFGLDSAGKSVSLGPLQPTQICDQSYKCSTFIIYY